MTKKTKILFLLIIGLTIFTLTFTPVLAVDLTGKLGTLGTAAGYTQAEPNLAATIGTIIRAFLALLGVIFMTYIIYGGYSWMTAKGNDEQITKAKAIIKGSLIGIIIVFAAYAISAFVIARLTTATGYTQTFLPIIRLG